MRFVALLWKSDDALSSRAAICLASRYDDDPRWRCALKSPGLTLYVSETAAFPWSVHAFPQSRGALLGALFGAPIEAATDKIVATGGRWLLEHAWGSYVALWRERGCDREPVHVMRDPSGQVPCYRWARSRCQVLFSDLADVQRLTRSRWSIDWSSVRRFLHDADTHTRATGLDGVSELQAGERWTFTATGVESLMLWEPAEICRRGGWIDDVAQARRELRHAAQTVIEAWGRRCGRILLHLSGGFDSAVVLGCAHQAGLASAMTAVNRFTRRPGEDERRFARAAAAHAAVDLIESEWGIGEETLESLSAVPLTPRPSVQSLAALESATTDALAAHCAARAQWTGQGGDHLFFQMQTDLIASDALRAHGVGRRWFAAVDDAARLTRASYWTAMTSAVHAAWRTRRDLPAGKQYQIEALRTLVHRPDPLRGLRAVPEVHPLISQPLIEAALRIPTFLLTEGGRGRALARVAFRDVVPDEIRARNSKGDTTVHLAALLRRNLPLLRARLLDGRLMRERLLERRHLHAYLMEGRLLRANELAPLLACLTAELWLDRIDSASGLPGLGECE